MAKGVKNMKHISKKHILRNTLLSVVALILMVGLGFGLIRYREVKGSIDNSFDSAQVPNSRDTNYLIKNKKPISILLMGTSASDFDSSYSGKTDTMMLLTINPHTEKTTITSIPHDLAVKIPGYNDPAQVSEAFEHGQAKASIETVQKLLNVPVDYYALININGMKKVIDKVGGIDIKPTASFNSYGYEFQKGVKTHMDGTKALAYSKETDSSTKEYYAHVSRQGEVLAAIMHKSTSIQALMNQDFIKTLTDEIQTDITFDDLTTIIKNYKHFTEYVDDTHIAATTKSVKGQQFEVADQKELQRITDLIRKNLELKADTTGNEGL